MVTPSQSFLTPEQTAPIDELRSAYEGLALQGPEEVGLKLAIQIGRGVNRPMRSLSRQIVIDDDREPEADPAMELTAQLQLHARNRVMLDLWIGSRARCVAWLTGREVARHNDSVAADGYEYGHDLIADRARRTAGMLVVSKEVLTDVYEELDEDVSIWDRAISVQKSAKKVTPAAELTVEDAVLIDELCVRTKMHEGRALAEMRRSGKRSKIKSYLTAGKSSMRLVKETMTPSGSTIETLRQAHEQMLLPDPVDLSRLEINQGVRIVGIMVKYIKGASRLDVGLVSDPRFRYVAYLVDNLTAYREADERNTYDNAVRKFAKKFQMQPAVLESIESDAETPD